MPRTFLSNFSTTTINTTYPHNLNNNKINNWIIIINITSHHLTARRVSSCFQSGWVYPTLKLLKQITCWCSLSHNYDISDEISPNKLSSMPISHVIVHQLSYVNMLFGLCEINELLLLLLFLWKKFQSKAYVVKDLRSSLVVTLSSPI
jgi:hypothetical protein